MRVLIADDEEDVVLSYKKILEKAGHEVTLSYDGEECLKKYCAAADQVLSDSKHDAPFDVVVLDYKMPRKDGLEVAKEILDINRWQRIVFASAYVKSTLEDSVKQLKQVVELMQKPFDGKVLVDTLEDADIYAGLQKLNVNLQALKGLEPNHWQLAGLYKGLQELMKGRTF